MKFGDRIKQRRIELHMSAGELGSLVGKNRATIYRYEKGDIESVPIEMLDRLSEALNVTPEYLMGWSDTKNLIDGIDDKTFDYVAYWHKTFGVHAFTEEEHLKIMEYAKFLIYMRDK